jgi:siroheme synthase-like protein
MTFVKYPRYYPIYLNVEGLDVLVVGGGTVAERKAESLLEAGAQVGVVSPECTERLRRLARSGKIRWTPKPYRSSLLAGARLVVGATDNPSVNARVYADCEARGILVNIVDDPGHCRFIVPAMFVKGPIRVSVATGGGAPGVTTMLRERLEKSISEQDEWLVAGLRKKRPRIRLLDKQAKAGFWKKVGTLKPTSMASTAAMEASIEKLLRRFEGQKP